MGVRLRLVIAAFAARIDADAPLDALEVGDVAPGATPAEWVDVEVRAAALNHHDVFSLRGRIPTQVNRSIAAGITSPSL